MRCERKLHTSRNELDAAREQRGDVTDVQVNGRRLVAGDWIAIVGERGLFQFHWAHLTGGEVESLTCFGGPEGRKKWRHFRPERIKAKKQVASLIKKGKVSV
ncbi:MAG: DUF7246 family protein [Acidimicrobiales bacterium]